jgi:hypothetical protein
LRETALPRINISGNRSSGHTTVKKLLLEGKLCPSKVVETKIDDTIIARLKELEAVRPHSFFHTPEAIQILAPATNEQTVYVIDGLLELCKHFCKFNVDDFLRMHRFNRHIPDNVGLIIFGHTDDVYNYVIKINLLQYLMAMTKSTDMGSREFIDFIEWIINDCGQTNTEKLSDRARNNLVFKKMTRRGYLDSYPIIPTLNDIIDRS